MSDPYLVPPPAGTAYPHSIASGTVLLYADPNWTSTSLTLSTSSYISGAQNSIVGSPLNDKANWVAFNLPAGTVMTLLQNPTTPVSGEPYNFAGAGVCVDLIGNGKVQTVDLAQIGAADSISAFIWRTVDMQSGLFQLFDGAAFDGARNTFFLSEWPPAAVHSLVNWWISDRAASIYFGGLGVESVTLYDGGSGEGQTATVAGWLSQPSPPATHSQGFNLVERGFADKAASWSWAIKPAVYQVIQPFSVPTTAVADPSLSITQFKQGTNRGVGTVTETAKFTYTVSQAASVMVTHTSTLTYSQSTSFTFGQSWGVKDVSSTSYSVTLNFAFTESYTTTDQTTNTTTQTVASELDQTVEIPPYSDWTSTLVLQFGKVPATSFKTTAIYYYDEPVPGSVSDPAMAAKLGYTALYGLTVTITGYVSASLSVNALSSITTTAIDGSATPVTTTQVIPTKSG